MPYNQFHTNKSSFRSSSSFFIFGIGRLLLIITYAVIFNTSKKRATIQLTMLTFCYEYEICAYTSECYIHIYMKNYIIFYRKFILLNFVIRVCIKLEFQYICYTMNINILSISNIKYSLVAVALSLNIIFNIEYFIILYF